MEIFNLEQTVKGLPIEEVAGRLAVHLGSKLTVFLSGGNNVSILSGWISGRRKPDSIACLRLRYGYIAAVILIRNYGLETARTAFMGMSPYLGDEAPAGWLRDHKKEIDLWRVIGAVRSFGEMGG